MGGLVLQYAKAAGAFTIATVSSDEKGEVAREAGADAVIVTSRTHWTDEVARLGRAHRGIDVVYDAVGSTLLESLRVVRNRGHVIFYGWAGGPAPGVDPRTLMDRSLRLSGGDLWSHIDNPEDLQSRAGGSLFGSRERDDSTAHRSKILVSRRRRGARLSRKPPGARKGSPRYRRRR